MIGKTYGIKRVTPVIGDVRKLAKLIFMIFLRRSSRVYGGYIDSHCFMGIQRISEAVHVWIVPSSGSAFWFRLLKAGFDGITSRKSDRKSWLKINHQPPLNMDAQDWFDGKTRFCTCFHICSFNILEALGMLPPPCAFLNKLLD